MGFVFLDFSSSKIQFPRGIPSDIPTSMARMASKVAPGGQMVSTAKMVGALGVVGAAIAAMQLKPFVPLSSTTNRLEAQEMQDAAKSANRTHTSKAGQPRIASRLTSQDYDAQTMPPTAAPRLRSRPTSEQIHAALDKVDVIIE